MTKRKSMMNDPWYGMTPNDLHIDCTDPVAELRTSNDRTDLEQLQRALDASTIAHNRMRAALHEAHEAMARGDLLSAQAAIKRGLGETQEGGR